MADIRPADLVEKFKSALNDKWGYIGGKAGTLWTESTQAAVETAFRNGDQDYEAAAKYGRRWIGHRVADCSGMFAWAFKQLGGYMYHGSNTMWSKYTTAKGKLVSGKREDGETLKPGTAVFKVRGTDYYHVGLYIGSGYVIEAQSTQSGVIKSDVAKWHTWGELKGVDYTDMSPATPVVQPVQPATTTPTTTTQTPAAEKKQQTTGGVVPMNTTNAVVVADGGVNMRESTSTKATRIVTIPKGARIKAEKYDDTWSSVEYDGKKGYVMTRYISLDSTDGAQVIYNEQMQIIANIEKELARLKSLLGV